MKAIQQSYSHRLFLLLPCLGLLVFFVSCTKPDKRMFVPHPALAEIDSLLWSQPDSAFMELQRFAESPDVDSLEVYNGHYYIRVYQLTWDCDTDERIENQYDFDSFDYSVKKNIVVDPTSGGVNVSNPVVVNFKATESIELNGEFVLPENSSLMIYNCPTLINQ